MSKLIYGIGINDVDYVIWPTVNGVQIPCPYHSCWRSMIARCYDKKTQIKRPTYIGCEVSEEWLTFSNFKAWMETQDWKGKQLDKDILFTGNKVYGKETCVFVSSQVNSFFADSAAARGGYMLGVVLYKATGEFRARCSDGKGKQKHLGHFETELEAHLAWKAYKHQRACELAEGQSDSRVAEALRKRFL